MDNKAIKLLKKLVDADKNKCQKNYEECIKEAKLIIKQYRNETTATKNNR